MTQTVRTPEGRHAVWIEADHGRGIRTGARKITWRKITLDEYIDSIDLEAIEGGQVAAVKLQLGLFSKGYAWEVVDGYHSKMFSTEREARAWAYDQCC